MDLIIEILVSVFIICKRGDEFVELGSDRVGRILVPGFGIGIVSKVKFEVIRPVDLKFGWLLAFCGNFSHD
jgi:hypothetical protein